MNKKLKYKQHDITDCGATCLASVLSYHGLKFPISRIRQYASTDKKGTNVLGMIEAAEKLGLTAKGVKGTFDSLFKIPKPSIAHVVVKNYLHHYLVIYKTTKKHIVVMDPGDGKFHKITHKEFKKQWTGVLILLLPSEEFEIGNKQTSIKKRFWQLIRPHKTVMMQALVGAGVFSILGLSTSIYVQKIVDNVLVDANYNLLNLLSIAMILILLLRIFIGSMKSIFALKTGQKIDTTLILGYYKHLMKLPQQFFDTMRVGEIISRVNQQFFDTMRVGEIISRVNDAVKIRRFINDVSLELIVNVLMVVFTILLMFVYSWKLALLVLVSIPIFIIIYFLYNRFNKKYLRKIMENSAELETQLVESVSSARTIKRFGLEEFSNLKTETRFIALLKSTYKSGKAAIFSTNAGDFTATAATIALLWFGATRVIVQDITPGELMSFYALIGYLINPVKSLIQMNQSIQDAVIAADRLFQIMDLEREETETEKIELTPEMIGDISFKNVDFRYGSRVDVFKNFSFKIEKGKMTAIVGESGSGKTTLISLLQNIYPIQSGNIEIGQYNLRHISNESLRKIVSVVPQDIDLFAGSVLTNIAVGEFEPNMKKVTDICNMISITEFIEKLPNGFHTYIGENGTSLSGGEKQRIAIARALYKNPEILILDEATSSLDSVSEQYIQQAINVLKEQNKTIIIIAHRLSTVMKADNIVLLKEGKIIETGNHKDLMQNKGEYFKLWEQQFSC